MEYNKLKKCPECGERPSVGEFRINGESFFAVRCPKCEAPIIVNGNTEWAAIKEWNEAVDTYIYNHTEPNPLDTPTPHILDSGNRTEFATGAVRDMREGKGRMDLMPLRVVNRIMDDDLIAYIANYMMSGDTEHLYFAISEFQEKAYDNSVDTMMLEVGKHFEEGAKKYGENNWQKGIEPKYYIDSAIRHYLKWRRGDKDEPHDRAFVWNIMCCIWECDFHKKVQKKDVAVNYDGNSCDNCKYESVSVIDEPCVHCAHNHVDEFEPKEATK